MFRKTDTISKNNRGFTLVELLVVIAIIGLLAGVVLTNLSKSRRRARDTKRKADLQQLAKAIQFFQNDNGVYPGGAATNTGDWAQTFKDQLQPYLARLPLDPLANDGSRYYVSVFLTGVADPNCNNKYVIYGYLEDTKDPDYGKYTCSYGGAEYFVVLP